MTYLPESIIEILDAPEGDHFEFKEAKNRYDFEEAAKYCCALSNCGGVILVIGNLSATIADRLPIENVDRKQRVVDYMANHDHVTTSQLADYLGLSQRTVRNILKELLDNGLVDRMDNYRHAKYMLKNAEPK